MSNNNKNTVDTQYFLPIGFMVLGFIAILAIGYALMGKELSPVLNWWFAVWILGVAGYPISRLVFSKFRDHGYIFAKPIGIAVASWLVWLLSTTHILKFSRGGSIAVTIVVIIVGYGLTVFYSIKKGEKLFEEVNAKWILYIMYLEVIFLALFIGACYMRGFQPYIRYDTEKYMDFGFMASMIKTDYFPAIDMFYAGHTINYYYFGQYIGTFITKFTGLTVGYGYNLDLMFIAALGFVEVYVVVSEIVVRSIAEADRRRKTFDSINVVTSEKSTRILAVISGFLGGLAVFAAGNLHYVIYANFVPAIQQIFGLEVKDYWFPSSTRYVGATIHEFPSYSFILGDLHAHVTDITFVLLMLGILFSWLTDRAERMSRARELKEYDKIDILSEALKPGILLLGFIVGIIRMTNFWDFPIYYVISGAVILFSNCIICGFKKDGIILTAVHGVEIALIGYIVALPFTLKFESMTTGIRLCESHSPFYQWLILWGLPFAVCIGLFFTAIIRYSNENVFVFEMIQKRATAHKAASKRNKNKNIDEEEEKKMYDSGKKIRKDLLGFINCLELSDLFILTIAACAMGLVLVPEFIYVKDIYIGDCARSNTVFKLVYQAYIIFGVIMGASLPKLIYFGESKSQRRNWIIALVLLVWTMGYFGNASKRWFGDLSNGENFLSLDVYEYVERSESQAMEDLINWVNENIEGQPTILQMGTTSYGPFATLSAYTGNPTIIGWSYHEWLWRNKGNLDEDTGNIEMPKEIEEAYNDMLKVYTSDDEELVKSILEKYDVDYILVSLAENLNSMNSISEDQYELLSVTDQQSYAKHGGKYFKVLSEYGCYKAVINSLCDVVYDGHTEETLGCSTILLKVKK